MKYAILLVLLLWGRSTLAQQVIPLYVDQIPNARQRPNEEEKRPNEQVDTLTLKVSVPTLTVFLPPKDRATRTAVIICPGGGYGMLLTTREGSDAARAFNKIGITAFVLKYRLPSDQTMPDKSIGPLQDAQQALKLVRERAAEWNIDVNKIGIMGYSAGGHLASTAGTHFGRTVIENKEKTSLRPDFMLLINPVISFTADIGHAGTRKNLLGDAPTSDQIRLYSNEFQINKTTPPAFLIHSGIDTVVPVANSIHFYEALLQNGIPGELHIYDKGEHGFLTYPSFDEWFGRCIGWMKSLELF